MDTKTMTPEVFAQAIVSIEKNYGLRLDARSVWLRMDDWKMLGRDQMGQKCGRGWQGLRGACKRVPKGGDKEAAIKASKVALADKIRKKKGLRDRNAPKVKAVASTRSKAKLAKVNSKSIPAKQSSIEQFDAMSRETFVSFIRSNPEDKGLADYQKVRRQFGERWSKANDIAKHETDKKYGRSVGIYMPSVEARKARFKEDELWSTIVNNGITQDEKGSFLRELPEFKDSVVAIAQKLGIETKGKKLSKIAEAIAEKAISN